MKRVYLILSLLGILGCKAPSEASFFVAGSCEECAELIEDALKSVEVEYVSWSEETSSLTVLFDGSEEQMEVIQRVIAEAGFDTQYFPANADLQAQLPECCRKSKPTLSVSGPAHSSPH